jgi:hypothetical protein
VGTKKARGTLPSTKYTKKRVSGATVNEVVISFDAFFTREENSWTTKALKWTYSHVLNINELPVRKENLLSSR